MVHVEHIRGKGWSARLEEYVWEKPGARGSVYVQINRWADSLTWRLSRTVTAKAPSRKRRPRWPHEPGPLRSSIRAKGPEFGAAGKTFKSVVYSKADYALFVDQGTRSYSVKLLPPWTIGGPSLFERGWNSEKPVIISKGQQGQKFFERSLNEVLRRARVYNNGGPLAWAEAARGAANPTHFMDSGYYPTRNKAKFIAVREHWRLWRDGPKKPRETTKALISDAALAQRRREAAERRRRFPGAK